MKILVLHRIPYHKVKYHLGIDHSRHEVVYVGTETALENIPPELPCRKVVRAGVKKAWEEMIALHKIGAFDGSQFDLVISLSEYELLDAAIIRETLGIKGPRISDVQLVRDKILMKQAVGAAGLRVPKHVDCSKISEAAVSEPWTGRSVLKPVDGASSENVSVYESFSAATRALAKGIGGFQNAKFELEEFVEGPILHIDGMVGNGRLLYWVPSRYIGTCLGYAKGSPLGSVQMPPTEKLRLWTQRVLEAVNIQSGSFHLEAIEGSDGLVFLEIANRVGGADVVDTFEMATNIYLPAAELALLTGDSHLYAAEHVFAPSDKFYGWFVFPGHHLPDGFAEISGLDAFQGDSRLHCLQVLNGKALPRAITYQSVDVPASGVVSGESSNDLERFLNSMFEEVKVSSTARKEKFVEERVACQA